MLWTNISGVPALHSLYEEIEQPLVPVLFRMEQAGVLIDGELLRQQSLELARHMREIEGRAYDAAGGPFSLESPKQLQDVLFGKLGLPVVRKTPTGQPSTAEDVLEELAEKYELPRLILDYRGFAKLKSTYTDKLPLQINRTLAASAHVLSPGCRCDRSALVDGAEPAEHSDPHARRPPHPPGLRRAAGLVHRRRRLLADRAAHHGAPVGRRGPVERVRRGTRHSPGDRRGSVRHGARRR